MRRSRSVAGALVIGLLTFAAVGSGPATAQPEDVPSVADVPDPIERLLADYGRAYRDHDEDLLRATVGPGLIDAERRALENAESVRFTRFDVVAVTQFSGDLASPRVRSRHRGKQVATYHVVERTQIGAETGTYEEDGAFTLLREPRREGYDGWRIVSKSDLDILGFFSPYHLWDEDDVSVLESDRFVLLTHPATLEAMRPVLDVAEEAYDRVDAFWPGRQTDRYVIVAPSTTAELGRIMHETIDLGKFVAFVAAGADRSRGWEPTGPRLFVHLSHLSTYGTAAQTEIVAHELVHAVTREASGPLMPTWVEEGLAGLGGGTGGRASRAGAGGVPDDFPSDDRFVTGPVAGIQAVYDQAEAAIATLEERFGRDDVAAFYAELGSRRVVAGTDEYHVRDAIEESAGWSYDAWVEAWRQRLG